MRGKTRDRFFGWKLIFWVVKERKIMICHSDLQREREERKIIRGSKLKFYFYKSEYLNVYEYFTGKYGIYRNLLKGDP